MEKSKIPSSIKYIIGNEAAERFSYYGLRSILTIYLATHFFNPTANPAFVATAEAKANEVTHFFITLNYLLPIAGALLADWFFGKYKVILWLSLVYCLGNFLMGGFTDNYTVFMTGLFLIAIGSGGIKPCVSANVGDQFDESNKDMMSKAFQWFYLSINFGSFFSTLFIPYILTHYGAKVAFGIPGILMFLATLIFYLGRKQYRNIPPLGFPKENFVGINFYILKNISKVIKGESAKGIALQKFSVSSVNAVFAVWKVLALFSFIPFYWMLSDQNSSEWVLQATKLDLNFLGFQLLPQQVQATNPIMILILTPLFGNVLYPYLEKRGFHLSVHRKLIAGFLTLILSFVIIYQLQVKIDAGQHPNVIWQILAYILMTTAEILVYLTGLEYAYAQAPSSMKSTIMAFWLLTISLGNYFVSLINSNISEKGFLKFLVGADYYLFYIFLFVIVSILFTLNYRKNIIRIK